MNAATLQNNPWQNAQLSTSSASVTSAESPLALTPPSGAVDGTPKPARRARAAAPSDPRSPEPRLALADAEAPRSTWRAVYTIVERSGTRPLWLRIGTAFVYRDQSLNVRLDAMPVNGQLHIRDAPPPLDERRDEPKAGHSP